MSADAFKGNLIITNLPSDMTGAQLADLFDGFGMVIGAEIRHIPARTGTATIGVVALAPESAVDRSIEAVNLTMIGERRVKVGRARQRPSKRKPETTSPKTASSERPIAPPALAEPVISRPARSVIVEYKPRRRLISNA